MLKTARLIAVVEDDVAMRKSIERLLSATGYEVIEFASAEEFLVSARIESVVGLVLDVHLAGMSGIELCRRLSAVKSRIPVVIITAYDDEKTRDKALALGCVDYLKKPFNPEQLTEALERAMRS
jgi:FixJ family two-component response regulator